MSGSEPRTLPDLLLLVELGYHLSDIEEIYEDEDDTWIQEGWRARGYSGEQYFSHKEKGEVIKWLVSSGFKDTGDGAHYRRV